MRKFYLSFSRCVAVLLILATSTAWSQSKSVTGKVTSSDDGTGLPGVNVLEKGTTNGTVTDVNGSFSINVSEGSTLLFSFVGFIPKEIVVGSQSSISVSLESDVTSLSEVVVVGYGSQDKKEITGSVVSLDTKDFNRGNINDPTQLLQGKVAGLSIYNKGGDPNSTSVVRLRGISTVGANTSPLVVIDGVLGSSLDNIDPNDIESISVLKDGSAAAIYGSRGSSGVILVTSKKGASKGVGVTYNTYLSAASVFKEIPVMSPDEYIAAGGNDLGAKTDWQDLVTQTGISNVHNIAVSGGNDDTKFRLSTNFRDINGVLKNSGFDQLNTRAGISHNALDNKLRIDANVSMTSRKFNNSFNEALRYAALYNPTAPVYFDNGDYYQAILFDNFNPVAIIDQNVNEGTRKTLNFGAKVDYTIFNDITLSANFGQQNETFFRGEYYSINSLFRGYNRHGLARVSNSENEFTLFEGYANYAKTFDRINLSATAGYSYQQDQSFASFVELGNFPDDRLGYNALETAGDRLSGLPNKTNISSDRSPVNKIIAFFGRANLTFDNAIFVNASIRREGSTKLGEENKWGTFPSVGVGVDLNKYLQLEQASLLKLRFGYGLTGSLPPASGFSKANWVYSFQGGGSVTNDRIANPDLKWEEKSEINAGIDFGILDGKLVGSFDAYSRDIRDFILLFVPPSGDAGSPYYRNSGSLRTSGVELNLSYNALQFGELKWTPGIILSHYQSELTDFLTDAFRVAELGAPGQNGTYMGKVAIGEQIGQIWGPVFDGVEGNGKVRFQDVNGDGVVIAGASESLNPDGDFKKLGNGLPTLEAGWTNKVEYRKWDLNLFIRGAFGHSLVNNFRAFYEPIDPGAINSYNRVITDKAVAGLTEAKYSSLYVEKAGFVKLDNVSLGYNFNLAGRSVKSLRLYATAQNLFQITNYTGIDPEPVLQDSPSLDNGGFPDPNSVNARPENTILAPGIDRRNNYFTARTFTFGLTIGL